MITLDLVAYIQSQLKKNISKDLIILHLIDAGWRSSDVEEGFAKALLFPEPKVVEPVVAVVEDEKKIEETLIQQPQINTPVKASSPSVDLYRELPELNTDSAVSVGDPKIWTPMSVKTVTSSIPEIKTEISKEGINVASPIESTPSKEVTPSLETKIEISKRESVEPSSVGPILSASSFNQNKKTFADFKPKVPAINPVSVNLPVSNSVNQAPSGVMSGVTPNVSVQSQNLDINKSQSPILSSFRQDIASASLVQAGASVSQNKHTIKLVAGILAGLLIVGGISFAFIKGYIDIPFSFIKKDPKIVLANVSTDFNKLKSYKIETDISLSSPSFANITAGLLSGEAVVSSDRDFISFNTKGLINRNDSASFDYDTLIKGSFLKSDILSNIKSDGNTSYISIPDLSLIIDNNYLPAGVVAVPNDQFKLIKPELPVDVQTQIDTFDGFNILSNIMSNSFRSKFSPSFKEFINSTSMVEKTSEVIRGKDSYHYEVVVDRSNTKKFLIALMDNFADTISGETKKNLEENLGAMTVDSFEIWVGKNDGDILQYKFTLSIPLSKVIGLDDKGIADNKVKLDWKTTYYDFDVANTITMPTGFIKIEDYIKTVRDMKLKNILSSFGQNSKNLLNAEGSYGKSSNKSGSCVSPSYGSIFSPLGHPKGASTQVGAIASSMNDLIALVDGSSACYSTLNSWSVSAPLPSDSQSFYCIDSKGASNILTASPKGTVCIASDVVQNVSQVPVNTTLTN